jgi:predicted nucleic acid-binding protein
LSTKPTPAPILVDTDVLIWHLRGYLSATRRLDELGALTLSAISWLEVLQGMRNKAARRGEEDARQALGQTAARHRRPSGCAPPS